MTLEAKELAERLRFERLSVLNDFEEPMPAHTALLLRQAADELDRLVAENERLRRLLQDAINICGGCGGGGNVKIIDRGVEIWNCVDCEEARAALQGSPPEAGTTGGRAGAG
jgi:glucokinase